MPTKGDDRSVEATCARVLDLQTQRRQVLGALEAACRAGDAEKMIAMRHRLPDLDDQLKDAKARWLAARRHSVQAEINQLDREIGEAHAAWEKAEEQVRASQLHIAQASPGRNQAFLSGRSGVLFAETGGPGVRELGERQQRARALQTQLHGLQTRRSNVAADLARVDKELGAWLNER